MPHTDSGEIFVFTAGGQTLTIAAQVLTSLALIGLENSRYNLSRVDLVEILKEYSIDAKRTLRTLQAFEAKLPPELTRHVSRLVIATDESVQAIA